MISILLFFSTYVSGFIFALRNATIFLFVLYQAVYFFNAENRWWGNSLPNLPYSFIVSISLIGLFLLRINKYSENKITNSRILTLSWLLMILFGITTFWAVLPGLHYDAWFNFLKLIIIITIAYKICNSIKSLDYILWGNICGAAYLSFYINQVGRNSGLRVEGVGTVDSPDANGVAAALAPSIVLCFYYFLNVKNIYLRFLSVLFGALIANAIILINSRASFLAILGSMAFYMFHFTFTKFKFNHQKLKAAAIVFAGIFALTIIVDQSTIERFLSIKENTQLNAEQETGSTRIFFWIAAVDLAIDMPLGAGYQGFNYYGPVYIPQDVHTGDSRNRTVHSTWFEALSEIGWLGLILLLLLISTAYFNLNTCKKKLIHNATHSDYFKVIAIQSSLICFVIAMSFINRLRAEILYWCLLYSAIAYNLYIKRGLLSSHTEYKKSMQKSISS